ncbi:MAG TPA: flagellar hook-associated protein FlgL [Dongiaceae bacterium]|nr:flagellar hook-associated protein FlgL [Dongiaceae bacterium]
MSVRLNPNILPDLLTSIQESRGNLNTATQQLSSGRRVNQLSDDPSAAAQLVANHDQAAQDDQFLQNLSGLQSKFQVADSTMSSVVTLLTRAVSIGTEGANGTVSASDRQAIAGEVQGLLTQLVSLGNTSYQGAYLFAGTASTTQPFTLDPATQQVVYNGNGNSNAVALLNGASVKSNVPGSQLFQNASGNAMSALGDLYHALQTGNNIAGALSEVESALSEVSVQRVFYGNVLNQITSSENFLSQDKVNLSSQENTLVGVDPAVAATDLAQSQTAYQSDLAATGQILNLPSLLDFLVH